MAHRKAAAAALATILLPIAARRRARHLSRSMCDRNARRCEHGTHARHQKNRPDNKRVLTVRGRALLYAAGSRTAALTHVVNSRLPIQLGPIPDSLSVSPHSDPYRKAPWIRHLPAPLDSISVHAKGRSPIKSHHSLAYYSSHCGGCCAVPQAHDAAAPRPSARRQVPLPSGLRAVRLRLTRRRDRAQNTCYVEALAV